LLATASFALAACSRNDGGSDMRTTTTSTDVSVAGIVHTRTERTTTEPVPEEEASPSQDVQKPQAGLLTAGDHDDLLNPQLYANYASRFLKEHPGELPFVDTRKRVAIEVVDSAKRPVPFAHVDVQRAGAPLHLVAAADGTASVYPALDKIPDRTTMKVTSDAGVVSRPVELSAGEHVIQLTVPGHAPAVSKMDLALVIDTTGSMGDEMAYLQAELDSIVARLKRDAGNLDLRIGLVVYRDQGDDYVVRSAPLTADIASIRENLSEHQAEGGGDPPEAVDRAMGAAEQMQWRPDAAKALLLVADAPPHDDRIEATLDSAEHLRSRGVQIVPVGASGVEENAEYVMRTMAALTQGRYIFLPTTAASEIRTPSPTSIVMS
jgi:hypothetical protein